MTDARVGSALEKAESNLSAGKSLDGTGFWAAVTRVKKDPALVERYGERIAAIDETAFRNWALVVVPVLPGTILALVATVVGLGLVGWAYRLDDMAAVIVFYLGFGIVLVTTHGLAHLAVGRMLGIRFTSWFIGTLKRPQPGVKIEYVSYLRAEPQDRAWMHASGAIVTKLIPFAMLGAAIAAGLPWWARWGLVGIGVASILTDAIWSTKASDWKKYRREMELVPDAYDPEIYTSPPDT